MEKKTYRVIFMADLTEDDVRAMKKCFYDAMNESMEIKNIWGLTIEEPWGDDPNADDEPNPDQESETPRFQIYEPSLEELLKIPMDHIQKVRDCFEACKSKADVFKVMRLANGMLGRFDVDFDDENSEFTIVNTYTDEDGFQEEHYWFDYPTDWEEEEEE